MGQGATHAHAICSLGLCHGADGPPGATGRARLSSRRDGFMDYFSLSYSFSFSHFTFAQPNWVIKFWDWDPN